MSPKKSEAGDGEMGKRWRGGGVCVCEKGESKKLMKYGSAKQNKTELYFKTSQFISTAEYRYQIGTDFAPISGRRKDTTLQDA